MSLIDRFKKQPTPKCDKCGCETDTCDDFHDYNLCMDCYRDAVDPSTMAEYAMTFPGSWHTFLKDNILGAGDLTISQITDEALWYFGEIYAHWFMEEWTK